MDRSGGGNPGYGGIVTVLEVWATRVPSCPYCCWWCAAEIEAVKNVMIISRTLNVRDCGEDCNSGGSSGEGTWFISA